MPLDEMTLAQARDEASKFGTIIDLIDTAMIERGYSRQFLLVSHLAAALSYCSKGPSDPSGFRRIRKTIDEFEEDLRAAIKLN